MGPRAAQLLEDGATLGEYDRLVGLCSSNTTIPTVLSNRLTMVDPLER